MPSSLRFTIPVLMISIALVSPPSVSADVRDRAVLSVTFDDLPASGAASVNDAGKAGKVADAVMLTKQPYRIPSAFVTGSPGYSLMLDPGRQQQVVVASSEDISRPDAVTISGLFASLAPLNDSTFHGLFAKRKVGDGDTTNYGINFHPANDAFQVYVNDGTGYKVANYSVKAAIGYRRRVHIAACFDAGDAPGADADTDADDIRVRLFINGQVIAPTKAVGGLVDGNAGWLQDVSLTKCVSDAPLTVGSSVPDGEMLRMICDDIHLFAESLSDDDARALFAEVAGASAAEIAAEQGAVADASQLLPEIVRMVPHAAEVGKTTRMIVTGKNLQSAKLHTDIRGVTVAVADGGNAGQAVFDVTVEDSALSERSLVRCVTPMGVSNPIVMTVDRVPTHADGTFTEANPAASFPVAATGLIGGTEQKRLWFKGAANQKIVAEVEARRIGSQLDPVVEIRSQTGTPLALQWQQFDLSGDARAAVTLPADGLYFAEVHDLQFRAPGGSPWRLIVGDLPPDSLAFPATVAAGSTALRTVGGDSVSEPVSVKKTDGQVAIESGATLLALPALRTDAGIQISEPLEGTFPATPVDATFTAAPFPALLIHGRISAPKESDSILLTVTPAQTLHFSVAAKLLSSPLRAELTLFNGDAVVARSDGDSGAADPSLSYTIPEGVTQLKVGIRDLNNKGSAGSLYRLQVARADRQAFVVSTSDGALRLPENGSIPLRLSIVRQSPSFRYTGAIRLSLSGLPGVTIVPETIPASDQDQQVFVMITRSVAADGAAAAAGQGLTIEARAEGPEPVFSTTVRVETGTVPANSLTLPDNTLVAGPLESVPATILLDGVPPILLRGVSATIPVRVIPLTEQIPPFVRFEMMTTEPLRREDPNKPDSPLKPTVSLDDFQFGPVTQQVFPLSIRVPLETPSATIDAVISADYVAHPLAASSGSKSWTAPILLFVEDAVTLAGPAEPVKGAKTATVNFIGTIHRHPLFAEEVTVMLDGLPQGFTAAPITVPVDQSTFTLAVTIPEAATAGEVPNLTLRVQRTNGSTISQPIAAKLIVE